MNPFAKKEPRRRQFSKRFDVKVEITTYFDPVEDMWLATVIRPEQTDSREYTVGGHSSLAAVEALLDQLEDVSQ